jgi:acyl-coenzyme A synthetase/AMP-(fatty) acid ligase
LVVLPRTPNGILCFWVAPKLALWPCRAPTSSRPKTGDTDKRDEDGYIWFVGRSDDIISSSSYRISPFEANCANKHDLFWNLETSLI